MIIQHQTISSFKYGAVWRLIRNDKINGHAGRRILLPKVSHELLITFGMIGVYWIPNKCIHEINDNTVDHQAEGAKVINMAFANKPALRVAA